MNEANPTPQHNGGHAMITFDGDREVHLAIGGHATCVADVGGADRPVLCCLHALALDRHAFAALAAQLMPRWRVIAFDQRGHGEHAAPARAIDLEAMARDVWELLDAQGVGTVHLLGHSMGGAVAATAAALEPGRCMGLVLVATPPAGGMAFAGRAEAAEREGMPAMVAPTLARWFGDGPAADETAVRAYARRCVERMPLAHWSAAWRELAGFTGYGAIGAQLPDTLCISAAADASTPPAAMDRIAAQVRRTVAHRTVAGAGHMLPLVRPAAVARLVDEHMKRTTSGAGQ